MAIEVDGRKMIDICELSGLLMATDIQLGGDVTGPLAPVEIDGVSYWDAELVNEKLKTLRSTGPFNTAL